MKKIVKTLVYKRTQQNTNKSENIVMKEYTLIVMERNYFNRYRHYTLFPRSKT